MRNVHRNTPENSPPLPVGEGRGEGFQATSDIPPPILLNLSKYVRFVARTNSLPRRLIWVNLASYPERCVATHPTLKNFPLRNAEKKLDSRVKMAGMSFVSLYLSVNSVAKTFC
jgi:hypothetical protein